MSAYKVYFHDPLARQVWDRAKRYMELMPVPYEELLQDAEIFLGSNPRPHIRPTNRGYYAHALRHIVVTENGFFRNTTMGSENMRIDSALGTLLHEMGHMIHLDYLPAWSAAQHNPGRWVEWSQVTGKALNFAPGTHFGNDDVIRSYEDFANDYRDWLREYDNSAGTPRRKFYYSLWKQTYTMQVRVGIGQRDVYVDGTRTDRLDIPPRIEQGRTILELRGIGEVLGARFDYEPKDAPVRNVTIYR